MKILLRAIITGFGLRLGADIYRQVARRLGLSDDKKGRRNDDDDDDAPPGATPEQPAG